MKLPHPVEDALVTEILEGLAQPRRMLPCKLFYDERGAELFERICELPEYYPTRTEHGILRAHGAEMAAWIGPHARIIEFGSGSGDKTRMLLNELEAPREYVAIDIAETQLRAFTNDLARAYPELSVRDVCADYTQPVTLPDTSAERSIVFFPGSTIGNFEPAAALDFLRNAATLCDGLLIGVDLKKDKLTLERAYNDQQGVTAEFNLNMLRHVNHICDADFSVEAFQHRAFYDEQHGRIEMHLISMADQTVRLARSTATPQVIELKRCEPIVTEYSYKYSIEQFQALASQAGFTPIHVWTDSQNRFSVQAFDKQ